MRQVLPVKLAQPEQQVKREPLAPQVPQAQPERQVLPVKLAQPEQQVKPELLVPREPQV